MSDKPINIKKKAFELINSSEEDTLQNKIIKLLDLQLEILEQEVNNLKYKLAHNELCKDELQMIHDSLVGVMAPEMEE